MPSSIALIAAVDIDDVADTSEKERAWLAKMSSEELLSWLEALRGMLPGTPLRLQVEAAWSLTPAGQAAEWDEGSARKAHFIYEVLTARGVAFERLQPQS